MAAVHAVCSVRAEGCSLWGAHHIGYSVCMHIINTCAAWWRCESESFSTKWSASRERNKEICSCQGSVSQRLLLEIFWKKKKNHTFEGLVLCCLRISSSDQWNQGEKKGEHGLGNSDVGMDTRTQDDCCFFSCFFFFGRYRLLPDSLEEGGEPKFLFWH